MSYNLANLSVLVVDQSAFMRHILSEMLIGFGLGNVHTAESGKQALARINEVDVDILVCDPLVEPVDGYELTRTIRNNPDMPNRYLPIIFLTGHADSTSVIKARDNGATEFLVKPISAAVLYERLVYVIENQRPFVQAGHYFGPDRRRKVTAEYNGQDRRAGGAEQPKARRGLTQSEVETILKGKR